MKPFATFLFRIYRGWVKLLLHLAYDFSIWKEEELPSGPKIFCANHFSSSDVHFVTALMKDPLHIVIGRGYGIPFVRHILKWMEQIPALEKEDRHLVVRRSADALSQGDSVFIFPEGELNQQQALKPFHYGVAAIYLAHPAPVIPIGLIAPRRRVRPKFSMAAGRDMTVVSKNYYANIGRPMEFPEALKLAQTDKRAAEDLICNQLKAEIGRLIDDIKQNKFWS